ncbi:unnamed protein product [Psylliodes chrysocephalus]|uniref:Uncharacterized protein n=1 Tax=Psylliodes chrysocephalus TaxID=3402493 RepID=A0A9P0CWU4_9CUCU|nr:unnamed protein product [Psylliodes chrysocephala]
MFYNRVEINKDEKLMATPKAVRKMADLATLDADNESDIQILDKINKLAYIYLPDGWLDWKVTELFTEDLLGDEMDAQLLNNIRFALPTVGLARAFRPKATSLSERIYRDMKLKMLDRPFCVRLIIGPLPLAAQIRGSVAQNKILLASLAEMKPIMIPRKEACNN